MTLQEFIDRYTGKGIDYDGSYGYQCVDLYRQYVKEVLGFPQSPGVTGAVNIWDTYLTDKFDRIENTPAGIPNAGDIMIWNKNVGGGYGHVAVFISGDVNKFKSFDQNWPSGSLCKIVEHTYTNVIGWLHPDGSNDALTACLESHSSLMKQLEEKGKELDDTKLSLDNTQKMNEKLREEIGKLKEGSVSVTDYEKQAIELKKMSKYFNVLTEIIRVMLGNKFFLLKYLEVKTITTKYKDVLDQQE